MKSLLETNSYSEEALSRALHVALRHETLDLAKVRCLLDSGALVLYTVIDMYGVLPWGECSGTYLTNQPEGCNALKALVSSHDDLDCIEMLLEYCPQHQQAQLIDGSQDFYPDAIETCIQTGFEDSAVEIFHTRMKVSPPLDLKKHLITLLPPGHKRPMFRTDLIQKSLQKNLNRLAGILSESAERWNEHSS